MCRVDFSDGAVHRCCLATSVLVSACDKQGFSSHHSWCLSLLLWLARMFHHQLQPPHCTVRPTACIADSDNSKHHVEVQDRPGRHYSGKFPYLDRPVAVTPPAVTNSSHHMASPNLLAWSQHTPTTTLTTTGCLSQSLVTCSAVPSVIGLC
jgi:hypothetical protein